MGQREDGCQGKQRKRKTCMDGMGQRVGAKGVQNRGRGRRVRWKDREKSRHNDTYVSS